MSPAPSIDVVIPTYGGWALTESCLRHLEQQTAAHTVIVADNSSPDGTPDRVRVSFPEVRVIESGGNLGFAVACNRGVAAGSGEIVVLLNNDVNTRPDFLERLVAPFADERIGSVSALLLRPGEDAIDSIGLTADLTLAGFPRYEGASVEHAGDPRPVLTGPSGGAAAYRRSAWEQVGGLDEKVFAYMEDLDLALRLQTAGWRAAVAPNAVGVHYGSATMVKRSAWQRRESGFSRGYFLRRYGVLRGRTVLRAVATETIVVMGDLLISRDLVALRGRLAGWHAARGLPRHPTPPPTAIDTELGFRESLRRRHTTYGI